MRFTMRPRGGGRLAVDQPFAKVSRFGGAFAGSGFRNAGTPGRHDLCRLQEVAARQHVRFAAIFAGLQHELRRTFGMLRQSCAIASFTGLPFRRRWCASSGRRLASARACAARAAMARMSRTLFGSGSAAAFASDVTDSRKRPML